MPDLMAIVSKAVFEKDAGKNPTLGTRLGMDRYVSANKGLEPLAAGGRLYLVTVRPPNEALWLVAVLEQPKFDGKQWVSAKSQAPITDISALRSELKFESGKGITAAPGALGMSLQTPRVLTAADAALIDARIGGAAPRAEGVASAAASPPAGPAGPDRRALLLEEVFDDPESDTARRVLAEELTARGDPRGEFILVDLALAGPLSIRRRDLLTRRRDELKRQHAPTWWPYKLTCRTRRGFVEAIKGMLGALTTASAQLFAAEPVVEVEVMGIDDEEAVEKLAKAKWLPRIRRLTVRGNLGDEGFAALVGGKQLAQLRALNVTANEISSLDALKSNLPACKTLVLTSNEFGDEGIAGLRAWRHMPQVETLYLSSCGLSEGGVAELVSAPLPKLEKLCLSYNELDDAGARAIASHAVHLPSLRFLELKGTGISRDGVDLLMKANLPALFRVDVRRNEIDEEDVADLTPRVRGGVRS
jgi:Leucine-rich repeat (LRR) protein